MQHGVLESHIPANLHPSTHMRVWGVRRIEQCIAHANRHPPPPPTGPLGTMTVECISNILHATPHNAKTKSSRRRSVPCSVGMVYGFACCSATLEKWVVHVCVGTPLPKFAHYEESLGHPICSVVISSQWRWLHWKFDSGIPIICFPIKLYSVI